MEKLVKTLFEEKNDKYSHIHRLSTRDTDEQPKEFRSKANPGKIYEVWLTVHLKLKNVWKICSKKKNDK